MIEFLLYLVAFVCFALAACNVPARVQLAALGLALWVLVSVVHAWPGR